METRKSAARRLCVLAAAASVLASGLAVTALTEAAAATLAPRAATHGQTGHSVQGRPDGTGQLAKTPSGLPQPKLSVSATARCAGNKAQVAVVMRSLEAASAVQAQVASPWGTKAYPSLAPLKSASHVYTVGGAAVESGRVTVTGLRPGSWITFMSVPYGALDCAP